MPGTFSADLLIIAPDQLRKIDFRLSKDFKIDGGVEWTVEFGLSERTKTSDSFIQVIKLTVKVKPTDNSKAEVTAKEGLDEIQMKAALAAADSAKQLSEGQVPQVKF
jgi:hypothetical protein